MNKHYVFVYGSLKRGLHNHYLLQDENVVYVGTLTTKEDSYVMYPMTSSVPIVVKNPNGHKVKGELYAVNDEVLGYLDILEGHPHFYRREKIYLDEVDYPVYMYIYVGDYDINDEQVEVNDGSYNWKNIEGVKYSC